MLHGTDLLVGTALDAAALSDVLAATLDVAREDVFLSIDGAIPDAMLDALGFRDIALLHVLPQPANLAFKVDLEFVRPIPIAALQALANAGDCLVALSRQTAFPDEIGRSIGEGYVIFQPGLAPRSGAIAERGQGDGLFWDWVPTDDPMPPLPK